MKLKKTLLCGAISASIHLFSISAYAQDVEKSTIWVTNTPDLINGSSGSSANPSINQATVNDYKPQGVFWGHMTPRANINDISDWVADVTAATNAGYDFVGRGEFDWGWQWIWNFGGNPQEQVDFALDLDLNPICFNFLFGSAPGAPCPAGSGDADGNLAWWPSIHSPLTETFIKWQVDRMFEGDISHVLFDSQTSSTRAVHLSGGDFSPHSINGFRAYLDLVYTDAQLAGLGVSNINTFDYRQFLIDQGYTSTSYRNAVRNNPTSVPLHEIFTFFTREKMNAVMSSVFDYVESKDSNIPISATTSIIEPRGMIFDDRLDFFAAEMFMFSNQYQDRTPITPLIFNKAAEYFDKGHVYFPFPFEWGDLQTRNAPKTARMWIAQAYATGAIFTAPNNLFANSVWVLDRDLYKDLYQFIDANDELFDDYESVSNVAYLWPVASALDNISQWGNGTTVDTFQYLVDNNIPFDMLVFGDSNRPFAPTTPELNEYDVLLTDANSSYLSSQQNQVIGFSNSTDIDFSNASTIASSISGKVDVKINGALNNQLVNAFPRASSSANDPYVVHLVNARHNPSNDTTVSRNNVTVEISAGLFDEPITSASFRAPGESNRNLNMSTDGSGNVTINVGSLDVWGVLVLEH